MNLYAVPKFTRMPISKDSAHFEYAPEIDNQPWKYNPFTNEYVTNRYHYDMYIQCPDDPDKWCFLYTYNNNRLTMNEVTCTSIRYIGIKEKVNIALSNQSYPELERQIDGKDSNIIVLIGYVKEMKIIKGKPTIVECNQVRNTLINSNMLYKPMILIMSKDDIIRVRHNDYICKYSVEDKVLRLDFTHGNKSE